MNLIPKFALRCIVTFSLLFGFAAVSFAQSEAEQAEKARAEAQTSAMQGSPSGGLDINAWKPGDPIPAEYIQKRKSGPFRGSST